MSKSDRFGFYVAVAVGATIALTVGLTALAIVGFAGIIAAEIYVNRR